MTRTHLSIAICILALAPAVPAQQGGNQPRPDAKEQQQLQQRLVAKQNKPVFQLAAWQFDYDQARKLAAERHQLLLAYFTRSYAH